MTCSEVLLNYIKKNPGFHKKVHLYAVAEDWSPETVGRDLRDLEEAGKIKVDYYKGKIHNRDLAMYAIAGYQKPVKRFEIIIKDGQRVAVPI